MKVATPVIIAGVGGVAALSTYMLAPEGTTKKYFGPAPLLGAGTAFLATYTTKQDPVVQGVGTAIGYIAGMLIGNMLAKQQIKKSALAQELMKQGLSEQEAIERARKAEEAKAWCEDSPVLSWLAPSCYNLETAESVRAAAEQKQLAEQQAAADKQWCADSPYLSWVSPSCY